MVVYRIYTIEQEYDIDELGDTIVTDKEVTIKYVDSIGKVNDFLKLQKSYNESCEKCLRCDIPLGITTRKYEMNKNKYESCNKKNIVSDGKYVKCLTMKSPDWNEYLIETIEVE